MKLGSTSSRGFNGDLMGRKEQKKRPHGSNDEFFYLWLPLNLADVGRCPNWKTDLHGVVQNGT